MSMSGVFPVTVVMRRRPVQSCWVDSVWSVEALLPGAAVADQGADEGDRVLRNLDLELHDDEAEGYLENWIAPAPRVFVSWRMEDGRACPLQASVSYAEGTRMFDSGDPADGVAMPSAVHDWLGDWLRMNYREPQRHGRARHGV